MHIYEIHSPLGASSASSFGCYTHRLLESVSHSRASVNDHSDPLLKQDRVLLDFGFGLAAYPSTLHRARPLHAALRALLTVTSIAPTVAICMNDYMFELQSAPTQTQHR